MEKRIIIDGFETDYYADDLSGNIISYNNNSNRFKGRRILKQTLRGNKNFKDNLYYYVELHYSNKKKKLTVHRLVWSAFNGEIPKDHVINHKDNCKVNNILTNLECVTSSYNRLDYLKRQKDGEKFKLELYKYGVYVTTCITVKQADKIIGSKSAASNILYSKYKNRNGWDVKKIII